MGTAELEEGLEKGFNMLKEWMPKAVDKDKGMGICSLVFYKKSGDPKAMKLAGQVTMAYGAHNEMIKTRRMGGDPLLATEIIGLTFLAGASRRRDFCDGVWRTSGYGLVGNGIMLVPARFLSAIQSGEVPFGGTSIWVGSGSSAQTLRLKDRYPTDHSHKCGLVSINISPNMESAQLLCGD